MVHMNLTWNKITAESQALFQSYEALRPIYMSEAHFLNQYIWQGYYNTQYATDDKALYLTICKDGKYGAFLPLCKENDLPDVFWRLQDYFNTELHQKLSLYLVDRSSYDILTHKGLLKRYDMEPDRDSYDYIYEAERLRSLSGKALHKKKNHLNHFLREYEGRFEYVTLTPENVPEIHEFQEAWLANREISDRYNSIDSEEAGIHRVLSHWEQLNIHMGGVRIDGKLEAYTMASYDPGTKCVYIPVEKASTNFDGLYNYINQQFLIHEFPEAELVNREDDLGQDNLRQSKLSYRPLRLEEKYHLYQD